MLPLLLTLAPGLLAPSGDAAARHQLTRLGHHAYRVRAEAHRALAKLGPLARPALERYAPGGPEAARRVELLLRPWEREQFHAAALKLLPEGGFPCFDFLPDYPDRLGDVLGEARRLRLGGRWRKRDGLAYPEADKYPECRLATFLWVRSQLWQRRPEAEILAKLGHAAARERHWFTRRDPDELFLPFGAPLPPWFPLAGGGGGPWLGCGPCWPRRS